MGDGAKELGDGAKDATLAQDPAEAPDKRTSQETESIIGSLIDGRYRVESLLGEGGMGLVYKAEHIALHKSVALKVLRTDVSKDDKMIVRFKHEAQAASAIGNEHIIDISDFGTLPSGATYFVMEHLNGRDLTQEIREVGRIGPGRTVHIAKQVTSALGATHEAGIIHRDLKPDNIMLIDRGRRKDFVKILDFGVAKVGSAQFRLTQQGHVVGTPFYMAPEQCAGNTVDHRTDIYSLGVVLYEMICGVVPFDADSLVALLSKHLHDHARRPSELENPPDIPESLELCIMKCLEKDPDNRYPTMFDLLHDLQTVEYELAQRGEAFNYSGVVSASGAMTPPSSPHLHAAAKRAKAADNAKRKKTTMVAVGAIALLLGVGAAALSFEDEPQEATPVEVAPPPVEPEVVVAEEEEAVQEEGDKGTVNLTIDSTPAQAAVWLGADLIGNTPVNIPRPPEGERLEVSLRKDGFEPKTVGLSWLTQENVTVTLKAIPEPEPEEEGEAEAEAEAEADRRDRRRARQRRRAGGKSGGKQGDMLDPWSDSW